MSGVDWEAAYRTLQTDYINLSKSLEASQQERDRLKADCDLREHEGGNLRRQIHGLLERNNAVESELANMTKERETAVVALDATKAQAEMYMKERNSARTALDKMREERNTQEQIRKNAQARIQELEEQLHAERSFTQPPPVDVQEDMAQMLDRLECLNKENVDLRGLVDAFSAKYGLTTKEAPVDMGITTEDVQIGEFAASVSSGSAPIPAGTVVIPMNAHLTETSHLRGVINTLNERMAQYWALVVCLKCDGTGIEYTDSDGAYLNCQRCKGRGHMIRGKKKIELP